MSSLDMPVILIVKAPNQQIEDQTIECELNWTIQRLKGHLSEVYPSKPRTEEQKLIYSGHLLHDASTLREVLRTYEGQQQHTVHLVCARQATAPTPKKPETMPDRVASTEGLRRRPAAASSSNSSNSSTTNNQTDSSGSSSSTPTTAPSPSSNAPNNTSVSTPTTVTTSTSTPTVSADPRHAWAAYYPGSQFPHYAQFPQMPSHAIPPQMAQLTQAQYAAWMQQAYAQYMAQYMHLMMAQAAGSPMQWPLAATVAANDASAAPNNDQPAAAQGQGNAGERAGAPEDPENPEDEGPRDWLEWFYIMSRIAVLFSVVWFYSSPMRFIVVFALGLFMYLYQIGFFRPEDVLENNNDPARADAINNNINNNDDNNNEPAAQAAAAGVENAAEDNQAGGAATAAAGAAGGAGTGGAAAAQEGNAVQPNIPEIPDRPSLLALSWTFFTSFFASLIPEQPNII